MVSTFCAIFYGTSCCHRSVSISHAIRAKLAPNISNSHPFYRVTRRRTLINAHTKQIMGTTFASSYRHTTRHDRLYNRNDPGNFLSTSDYTNLRMRYYFFTRAYRCIVGEKVNSRDSDQTRA